ncbi:hypothetical protein BDY19DRAFT_646374 [Irpex rosettiformis]|uniref:Uncharacterized protein n=1 Tax=Irpex rosettiformis TaxID=378272 RepID=A0ACB8UC77_9APHY|nr:hypothetical protein BDY19DRAFT_646374 [Irpex rosettiformis]
MATEIQREQRAEDGSLVLDEVQEYYYTSAKPILTSASIFPEPNPISISGFLHAFSLVSSRAFLIDAYHGLAMVPIADAFNHTQENHVHLESEHDVCTSCGSFEQCPHDQDNAEEIMTVPRSAHLSSSSVVTVHSHDDTADLLCSLSRSQLASQAEVACEVFSSKTAVDVYTPIGPVSTITTANSTTENFGSSPVDTCDMVSNLAIPPGEEVFNTYGEHLTNAQLLARYGFMLDGNENDVVTFDDGDLPLASFGTCTPNSGGVIDTARQVLELWPRYNRWKESSLVYHADTSAVGESSCLSVRPLSNVAHNHSYTSDREVDRRLNRGIFTPMRMCVNSDAKITHELWVCCALLSLAHLRIVFPTPENEYNEHHGVEAAVAALVRLADRQLYWEAQSEFGVEDNPDGDDDEGDDNLRERASKKKGTTAETRLDKVCSFSWIRIWRDFALLSFVPARRPESTSCAILVSLVRSPEPELPVAL